MSEWTKDELRTIGDAEELHIQSQHADGSLSRPTTIWVVRDGDELYVRAVNGPDGKWYQGAQERHEGHIEADGVGRDVEFEEADHAVDAKIDAEYRAKYRGYSDDIVGTVVTDKAKAATLKLVPH
ncbi:DUF2255 family protein [Actinocorallia sp. A-T 12471]|uniref:DUF2255 family protein n=1 Tax=Actinocorallia sp. A-T 12471 TaxID=3089813 RepID=UPI0029CD117C|nr:DUF2255 family protein [Actinocorallia sp. A-T 12471]MDX6744010.1 DUF2255 family protein [Actinocorallia sp. A-T 12471]